MSELFLKILNMSMSASWLVLVVLIFRLVLQKAPKWVNVLLWGIVAVKLICPVSIESPVSLIPKPVGNGELVSEWMDDYVGEVSIIYDDSINYDAAVAAGREPVYDGNGGYYVVTQYDQLGEPSTIENTVMPVLATIWVVGVALLFLYIVASYLRLRRKVSTAIPLREKTYQSENVSSPFVFGIINPKIYLPFDMSEQDLTHVIAHEQAHIRRKDHWWKPLGFLLLTVHWFNPLMWFAYVLLCRDIELACDEKVIKKLGNKDRADYTQALLSCSVNRRTIAACPLAFGEVSVKERVKSVMNYRKPAFWFVIVAIVACVGVAVTFLTNPVEDNSEIENQTDEHINANLSDAADNAEQANNDESRNTVINETSYYLELASGKEFQEMGAEQSTAVLKEYGTLLDGYTLLTRESTDKTAAYILGYYNGTGVNSPFSSLHTMEFSLPMEDAWQLLYQESDSEAVEQSLANGESPDVGYVIKDSHIQYTSNGELIMIQPTNVRSNLVSAFTKSLTTKGREYIADAVSRGIALNTPEGPYITVYLISEKYGEISEMIPISNDEAQAIQAEDLQIPDFGLGFAAGLCIDGETVYYTESSGVPQSVLALAQEKCGYKFVSPKDITASVVEAKLECDWLDAPLYADESDLNRLEEILHNAEFGSVGGCGYGAKLTIKLSDGKEIVAFKGCDGCDTMVFGSYGGYFIGDSENTEFWGIFGLDVETKEPLLLG